MQYNALISSFNLKEPERKMSSNILILLVDAVPCSRASMAAKSQSLFPMQEIEKGLRADQPL